MVTADDIHAILHDVTDPEIPVLSIYDLGIVREVLVQEDLIEIKITPTYSGCPAMDAIAVDIRLKLAENGFKNTRITHVLAPAWTTDWMTAEGKEKLLAYGIAPPTGIVKNQARLDRLFSDELEEIHCPRCGSADTRLLSQFGSTACKSLHQCNTCKEPFDHFKCH
jgi:ring-1,2-phenylacetyl-CoA epoxidase subunit PaaD